METSLPLPGVNNMAEKGQHLMNFTVTSRPPSGKIENVCSNGFQYRGKMFSGSQGVKEPSKSFKESGNIKNDQKQNLVDGNKDNPRRIHSAKGRLERHNRHTCVPLNLVPNNEKRKASVIDINTVSCVPDYEKQMLLKAVNVRAATCKQATDLLTSVVVRPSSAKASVGCPVVKPDNENSSDASNNIKPSVYGLRVGRQVFGCEPKVLEAWKDVQQEFPYKMSKKDSHLQNCSSESNKSSLPSTLQPLHPYLQEKVPSSIIGLDPSSCLVFLSHDFHDTVLPEVPPPQDPSTDLPYTCIVETPRVPKVKKYKHPTLEREHYIDYLEKCSHSDVLKPSYNGDISNLLQRPYTRSPDKIRKEITELEDLMRGIGSLTSNCSFVQFQAEITQAKELATKLYKLRPREESQEPIDTFGLLKLYKDHELIFAALQQRRNYCLEELAFLERN